MLTSIFLNEIILFFRNFDPLVLKMSMTQTLFSVILFLIVMHNSIVVVFDVMAEKSLFFLDSCEYLVLVIFSNPLRDF